MARRRNPETEAPVDSADQVTEAVAGPEPAVETIAEPIGETMAEPEPEPASPPPAAPQPPPVAARPGIFGPILGGAVAAVAGFGLSHFDAFGLARPAGSGAEVAALSARLDALEAAPTAVPVNLDGLQDALSAVETRIAALEAAPAPPPPDLSALDALSQRLAAIEAMPAGGGDASTAALAAKLADLERRLAAQPQAVVDTSEVDAALARLEAAEAEATARAEAAAEAAASANRAVALDRLRSAVATGSAFDAELAALGDADLTAALTPHVAGVTSLADLQAGFPDLVRQALDVARAAEGDQGWGARIMDFLAAQTGARPLTPQEGTTPEAILSRADFAVTEGRLADAAAEIAVLPPDVQAVFADWTARAGARLTVDMALEAQ
jgi:hypothetical protein